MNRSDIEDLLAKRAGVKPSSAYEEFDEDGETFISPGLDGMLAASEKLLAVNRGLAPVDDRDSMQFKRVYDTPRLMRERVRLDNGKRRQRMLRSVSKQRSLKPVSAFIFDDYAEGQLIKNPLSSPLEEINPLQLMEQSRRMTLMGPGGVGSENAITEEMQSTHPSQFGYLSALEGPESEKIGIDTRAAWGSKVGSDGKLYQRFLDRKSGRYRWMSPEDLDGLIVKLPD